MTTKTIILDFQLSNNFEKNKSHINAKQEELIFNEIGVERYYICQSLDDPQKANVIFQRPENVLYDIIMNPETKPIFEALGNIYSATKITL